MSYFIHRERESLFQKERSGREGGDVLSGERHKKCGELSKVMLLLHNLRPTQKGYFVIILTIKRNYQETMSFSIKLPFSHSIWTEKAYDVLNGNVDADAGHPQSAYTQYDWDLCRKLSLARWPTSFVPKLLDLFENILNYVMITDII